MKFKNIKKNPKASGKKKKSPSNSRTITEHFKLSFPKINSVILLKAYRGSLKVFIFFIFILAAIIVGLDLQQNIETKQKVDAQRSNMAKKLEFWESFIVKHKDYRDAYLQASVLQYQLGNMSKAKMYVEKGLVLDPNSQDGRKIEELLK